jgi:hypothetical protein
MGGWRDFALRELFYAESGPAEPVAPKIKGFAEPDGPLRTYRG